MTFDVQNVDLDQLADVAMKGGIEALEELATTGKAPVAKPDEGSDAGKDEAGTEEAAGEGAKADPKADEAKADPAKTDAEDKEHGTAVSNKSGTGTIPYSVLKGARDRAAQVELENIDLRKQLDELKSKPAEAAPATVAEAKQATDEVDTRIQAMQERADTLSEDFPELAALLKDQIELLQATRKQLVDVQRQREAEREEQQAAEQKGIAEQIQDAIDGNPVLAFWQSKNGAEMEAATNVDMLLRQKPEWSDKTFEERFAEVVKLVRAVHPEFEVPAAEGTSTEQKKQAAPKEQRPPVNSLSDIPGGVPPVGGKREQIEEMSVSALGNKFLNMTPEQIQAELAALGM